MYAPVGPTQAGEDSQRVGPTQSRPYNPKVAMDVLETDWFILQDPTAPGEHLILESVGLKLSALWLATEEAEGFTQASPAAQGMLVQKLEGWALKESFLVALGLLSVDKVLVGYQPGLPGAFTLDRANTLEAIHHRMLPR